MKLTDLPQEVITDLSDRDRWRLDVDYGFDAKHEFFMSWKSFITLPKSNSFYQSTEEDLAEFIEYKNRFILLPIGRKHHPLLSIIRAMVSMDEQSITLFIHDSYHQDWFTQESDARYGFLAIADRYQKFSCDFYLASYYHFSYLLNDDYEVAKTILRNKLNTNKSHL